MAPSIQPGNLVLVQHVPAKQIAVGDVITYSSKEKPGQTITHRVTQVRGGANKPLQFVTQGDANPSPDAFTVPEHRVVGKVGMAVPYAGFAADFLRTPLGLALAIYLPALLVVITELRRLSAHYDRLKSFRLPWVKGRLYNPTTKDHLATGTKTLAVCFTLAAVATLPANAALTDTATLTDNNLITTRPAADHILIIGIFFRDKASDLANTRPQLKFYNPTKQTISLNNWTIHDNQGEIFRFRGVTRIEGKQTFTYNPQTFTSGFQYSGDRLVLKDASGQVVDAISWGSDTSQLNPAAPTPAPSDKLQRRPRAIDTNTANDWQIKP